MRQKKQQHAAAGKSTNKDHENEKKPSSIQGTGQRVSSVACRYIWGLFQSAEEEDVYICGFDMWGSVKDGRKVNISETQP